MSRETYMIPKGATARFNFEQTAISLSTANAVAWGIPESLISSLTARRSSYEPKYSIASNRRTRSPAATSNRDAEWNLLEVDLIDLYNHYLLNNDAISAADKDALHINDSSSGSKTSAPAPVTNPVISFETGSISMLKVVYSDSLVLGKHYKPTNVAFCELVYVLGTEPASVAECSERINITRSHQPMMFADTERGKKIYAFGRWVNRNGKFGPWSQIASALIP